MRKKLIVAAVSLAAFTFLLLSFGVSQTGLFHLPLKTPEKNFDEAVGVDETAKWKLVGNVSVRIGSVSRLGT